MPVEALGRPASRAGRGAARAPPERACWRPRWRSPAPSREEIEARLRDGFEIEDTGEILDAILGPEG